MITEADLAKLTHRQREVLTALARELSSDEVARLLHIAEATLKIDMTSFRVRFHHGRALPARRPKTARQCLAGSQFEIRRIDSPLRTPILSRDAIGTGGSSARQVAPVRPTVRGISVRSAFGAVLSYVAELATKMTLTRQMAGFGQADRAHPFLTSVNAISLGCRIFVTTVNYRLA